MNLYICEKCRAAYVVDLPAGFGTYKCSCGGKAYQKRERADPLALLVIIALLAVGIAIRIGLVK
jgi:hypothetical protein